MRSLIVLRAPMFSDLAMSATLSGEPIPATRRCSRRVHTLAQQAGDRALHRDALAGAARTHEEVERAERDVAQRMRVVGGGRVQPGLPQVGVPLLPTPGVLPPRVEVEQVLAALKIPHMMATIAQNEKNLII